VTAEQLFAGDGENPDAARLRGERDRAVAARDAALVDLGNAEVSLRAARRQITVLKRALHERETGGEWGAEIAELFSYWQWRCQHPRAKLDVKRAAALRARLNAGHSVADVMEAIDGAALDPFVDGKGKRHDELELVCRDEVKFDSFRGRRVAALERQHSHPLLPMLKQACLPAGAEDAVFDPVERAWLFKCPVCRFHWDDPGYTPLHVAKQGVWCTAMCVPPAPTVEQVKTAIVLPPREKAV
jgi:hypothetical protein